MAFPFLSERREERSLAVFTETLDYLRALDAALPYYKIRDTLPPGTPLPALPEQTDCMRWYWKVVDNGLPNPGTWLDQPMEFMEDMDSVRLAKEHHTEKGVRKQEIAIEQQAAVAQVPSAKEILEIIG